MGVVALAQAGPAMHAHALADAGAATALLLGVTSHRDLRPEDVPQLRGFLDDAIGQLRAAFPELALAMLSPLAEGGDQLAAEVALAHGAQLYVPLPMPVELYLDDFADAEARTRFLALLARATPIQLVPPELDLDRLRTPGPWRNRQYLAAGLHVANHCHLLLALWDGTDDGGRGGTSEIVRYYLGGPLPGARRATDNLRQMLAGDDDSLILHVPVRRASAPDAEPPPPPRWLTSAGARPWEAGMPPDYRRIFERMQVFERDRRRLVDGVDVDGGDPVERALRVVDAMAVHYQRLMTWAMRAIHTLAVVMGLSFLLYSDLGAPSWMLWVFLLFFVFGFAATGAAHHYDWHRKYIDYRALAEGLRVQAFWRRAGLLVEGDPEFAHDNFLQKQDVELGWIRNVMRQLGLQPLPASVDPAAAVEAVIEDWVGRPGASGQLGYYARKAALREHHHRRTQALGQACLWTGIAISVLLAGWHAFLPQPLQNVLVTSMGALSLIAAVREAYAYRKADKELVKQYRFMQRIYGNARVALDGARTSREKREILRALGEAALAEHAEWALMHRDRPIEHGKP